MVKKNKKVSSNNKPSIVLSRRAAAGWAVVIFVVCAWMFVVGVLVGRGTTPVKFDIAKLQEKLEAVRRNLTTEQQGHRQESGGIVKDKTKLDFYEALKERHKDTKVEQITPLQTTGEKKESLPANELSKAKKEDTPETRSSRLPPEEQIASKSKSKPSTRTYTIQAASVKVAKDADRLVAELKKKGFPAYRAIGKVQGKGIWYRVRIGEYKSRADARSTMQKLRKTGLKPILIEKQ